MTQNVHVSMICCRPEVVYDVISGKAVISSILAVFRTPVTDVRKQPMTSYVVWLYIRPAWMSMLNLVILR